MTQWYVKELSQLTDVSVQTLHHYDRIGLLKPSLRLTNGYRKYSENDLLRLQQIIALKYFGFDLSTIKVLLAGETNTRESLLIQNQILERKAKALLEVSDALKRTIAEVNDDKSIPWKFIIQLIEVYRMTEKLEHSWVKDIFTPEELKQYAHFESELKANSTPEQQAAFETAWGLLVNDIEKNLNKDPNSEFGISIGKRCMDLINQLYGKKFAHLRTKIYKDGFMQGKGLDEVGLTPEVVQWLADSMSAYWKERIYTTLQQVEKQPHAEMLKLWNGLLDEIEGENAEGKKEIQNACLEDPKISPLVKKWLRNLN